MRSSSAGSAPPAWHERCARRRLLEAELAELERRWQEEEQLAAIVDGELTPLASLERLRRALRSGG